MYVKCKPFFQNHMVSTLFFDDLKFAANAVSILVS